MSKLIFNGISHTLTLVTSKGAPIGHWKANNVVDRKIKDLRFLPNWHYHIQDTVAPHKHHGHPEKDNVDGPYGTRGIIRLRDFVLAGKRHSGVGVHAGRRSKHGPDHATHGCIRTNEEAMHAIVEHMGTDPLTSLIVEHNHDQHSAHPPHSADHH